MKATFYRLMGCLILQGTLLYAQPPELIVNGDFTSGNTGFTTDYINCNSQNCLFPEGYYAIGADPTFYHPDFFGSDHTDGTGNLMIVNGSGTLNAAIWCETIPVSSNVNYKFSYWLTSVVTVEPAMLQVNVNGSPAGGVFIAPSELYAWKQFSIDWYSGDNTSVSICIVNQNTAPGGNDFGLDDISLKETTCPLPTNLSVTNITNTSAKIKWGEVAEAQRYKLRYRVTGSNAWTTITNISSTSKTVTGLLAGTSYTWQVKSVCSANPIVSSGWTSDQTFTTASLRIGDESPQQISFSVYPNPARDHATIQLTFPPQGGPYGESSYVSVKVYDVSGREIETLLDSDELQGEPFSANSSAGTYSFELNTAHFSNGVYVVRVSTDDGIVNRKLVVQ